MSLNSRLDITEESFSELLYSKNKLSRIYYGNKSKKIRRYNIYFLLPSFLQTFILVVLFSLSESLHQNSTASWTVRMITHFWELPFSVIQVGKSSTSTAGFTLWYVGTSSSMSRPSMPHPLHCSNDPNPSCSQTSTYDVSVCNTYASLAYGRPLTKHFRS